MLAFVVRHESQTIRDRQPGRPLVLVVWVESQSNMAVQFGIAIARNRGAGYSTVTSTPTPVTRPRVLSDLPHETGGLAQSAPSARAHPCQVLGLPQTAPYVDMIILNIGLSHTALVASDTREFGDGRTQRWVKPAM